MSVSNNPTSSLSIYDLLTRLFPGALLIFSVYLLTDPNQLIPTSGLQVSIVVFLSFVAGEFVNIIRLSIYDVPNHFRRVLYKQTGNEEYLGFIDQNLLKLTELDWIPDKEENTFAAYTIFDHKEESIIELLKNRYSLPDDFNSDYGAYEIITSELSGKESRRTQRLRAVYVLTQNTQLVLIFSVIISISILISENIGQSEFSDGTILFAVIVLAISLISFVITYYSARTFTPVDRVYIDSLFADFFVSYNNPQTLSK